MTFGLPSIARKRESPGVAGPAVSDCAAPDEVVASVADGVDA